MMPGKWKNSGILALLLAVLGASYGMEQMRLSKEEGLQIPVVRAEEKMVTVSGALDAVESYRLRRQEQREKDKASLEKMILSEHTQEAAREDAQRALTRLVTEGEMEMAMEGAMTGAGFSPCLCVAEGGSVTLTVGKTELTQGETSLLITMAQSHTGAPPEKVIIITGSML